MLVVAEIGINHNGSLDIARRLIDAAKSAGADAVKFQKRTVDRVYSREVLDAPRASPFGTTTRQQKHGLEFGEAEYRAIDAHCRERHIAWFASAWDLESLAFLRRFDLAYNKVASAMIVDEAFLRAVAAERKHTFVSTGMSTLATLDRAVEIFRAVDCPFALMHCVSSYPVADAEANLMAIPALRARYGCDVGYSGHDDGLPISLAAAALGISVLERHITLDRAMYGSDQAASLEPVDFRALVEGVRRIEAALGDGCLGRPTGGELRVADKLRAHLAWDAEALADAARAVAAEPA